ncbi:MAG: GNAT family N-acetyltransferase [Myxococcota bacterium]|nr:GNAT family N-acetyltransferase [Myxococcota bacterium]
MSPRSQPKQLSQLRRILRYTRATLPRLKWREIVDFPLPSTPPRGGADERIIVAADSVDAPIYQTEMNLTEREYLRRLEDPNYVGVFALASESGCFLGSQWAIGGGREQIWYDSLPIEAGEYLIAGQFVCEHYRGKRLNRRMTEHLTHYLLQRGQISRIFAVIERVNQASLASNQRTGEAAGHNILFKCFARNQLSLLRRRGETKLFTLWNKGRR